MAKLLFLVANFFPTSRSVSKQVATSFINEYISYHPRDEIKVLNLCDKNYPKVDLSTLEAQEKLRSGFDFSNLDPYQQTNIKKIDQMCEEFLCADKYVVVAPNWNLMVPPQIVDYFLCVNQMGKTFDYVEGNPVGLLKDKKILMITSSGSGSTDVNSVGYNVGISWVKNLFSYIGVSDFDLLAVENTNSDIPEKDHVIKNALVDSKIFAKTF